MLSGSGPGGPAWPGRSSRPGRGARLLGAALDLPAGVQDLSPYAHLPHLPAASLPASDLVGPWSVLAALAAVLAVGLAGYRRRDIPA